MMTETRSHHGWRAAIACVAASVLLLVSVAGVFAPMAGAQMPQPSVRTLTGMVTGDSHEPIRGAVVELRNSKTDEVVTYITDATGQYNFKRLDGRTDYEVWVMFRGRRSDTRSISMFDSHMDKVINFTIRTY